MLARESSVGRREEFFSTLLPTADSRAATCALPEKKERLIAGYRNVKIMVRSTSTQKLVFIIFGRGWPGSKWPVFSNVSCVPAVFWRNC